MFDAQFALFYKALLPSLCGQRRPDMEIDVTLSGQHHMGRQVPVVTVKAFSE
jgi:hypothetical protein